MAVRWYISKTRERQIIWNSEDRFYNNYRKCSVMKTCFICALQL